MIETYKILHGIYDTTVSPVLPVCHDSVTRGNTWKLVKNVSKYDTRKYVFTQRIVNTPCLKKTVPNYFLLLVCQI